MSTKSLICTRPIIFSMTAICFFMSLSTAAFASENEAQCTAEIQGKIAWDGASNMAWDDENVKRLCKGTSNPKEPGKCFLTVNSEHAKGAVNWGNGTHWEWTNVVNLCAGTNDSNKTVSCFNGAIKSGLDWRDAILQCQRSS